MLMPPQSNWQDNRFRHSSRPHSRSCKVLHLTCATGLFDIPADEDSLIRHYGVGSGSGRNDTLSVCLRRPEIFAGEQDVRPAQRRDVG